MAKHVCPAVVDLDSEASSYKILDCGEGDYAVALKDGDDNVITLDWPHARELYDKLHGLYNKPDEIDEWIDV